MVTVQDYMYYRFKVKGCVRRETLVDLLFTLMELEGANGCGYQAEKLAVVLQKFVDGHTDTEDFEQHKEHRNIGVILGDVLWDTLQGRYRYW